MPYPQLLPFFEEAQDEKVRRILTNRWEREEAKRGERKALDAEPSIAQLPSDGAGRGEPVKEIKTVVAPELLELSDDSVSEKIAEPPPESVEARESCSDRQESEEEESESPVTSPMKQCDRGKPSQVDGTVNKEDGDNDDDDEIVSDDEVPSEIKAASALVRSNSTNRSWKSDTLAGSWSEKTAGPGQEADHQPASSPEVLSLADINLGPPVKIRKFDSSSETAPTDCHAGLEASEEIGNAESLNSDLMTGFMKCSLCNSLYKQDKKLSLARRSQLLHVSSQHLNKPLWRCLHCDHTSKHLSSSLMKKHLATAHGLSGLTSADNVEVHLECLKAEVMPELEALRQKAFDETTETTSKSAIEIPTPSASAKNSEELKLEMKPEDKTVAFTFEPADTSELPTEVAESSGSSFGAPKAKINRIADSSDSSAGGPPVAKRFDRSPDSQLSANDAPELSTDGYSRCSLCLALVKSANDHRQNGTRNQLNHIATWHFDEPLWRCLHCGHTSKNY